MKSVEPTVVSQQDGIHLIDVREEVEFVGGHARAAVNLPLSTFVERIAEVPRTETLYIICESGARSAQAVDWLEGQGYDAVNVLGGTAAWRSAGLPLVVGN